MLSKEGFSESEIKVWAQKCDQVPANSEIQLPAGIVVKKRKGPPLVPKFDDNCTCELAAMLIGYEFLALLVGETIYNNSFNHIREFIKTGQTSAKISIEALHNPNQDTYRSRHEIDFIQNNERLIITVKFLGASVYKITLSGFVRPTEDICFIEDLKQKKSFIAYSHDDAKKGKFHGMDIYT